MDATPGAHVTPRRLRVACIIGTRPEAVKMAPVANALRRAPWAEPLVLVTAQHRSLMDEVLALFDIVPDVDLDLMRPGQTLSQLAARVIAGLDGAFDRMAPDVVLAQGDTTTVVGAALAAFHRGVPFGHLEAGLRTGDPLLPFPEETYRRLTGRLARWHFAPTPAARANLLAEGVEARTIHLTGNTVIDALLDVANRPFPDPPGQGKAVAGGGSRMVLVTAHRRENFGAPLASICRAVRTLAETREDCRFVFPVHPNPAVRGVVEAQLGGHPRVALVPPMGYAAFVRAMRSASLVLTDSGGVQEEAPALGKPVLVLREQTERPEAVAAGVARLVGTDHDTIVSQVVRLLDDPAAWRAMAKGASPYGDGHAAERIVAVLEAFAATQGRIAGRPQVRAA